jgi:hypothetical protein
MPMVVPIMSWSPLPCAPNCPTAVRLAPPAMRGQMPCPGGQLHAALPFTSRSWHAHIAVPLQIQLPFHCTLSGGAAATVHAPHAWVCAPGAAIRGAAAILHRAAAENDAPCTSCPWHRGFLLTMHCCVVPSSSICLYTMFLLSCKAGNCCTFLFGLAAQCHCLAAVVCSTSSAKLISFPCPLINQHCGSVWLSSLSVQWYCL